MEKYDYRAAMINDIKRWIKENDMSDIDNNDETIYEYLDDTLWGLDEITGNGAYFYDTEDKCAEYVCHNFDLALEACEDLCVEMPVLKNHNKYGSLARYLDCTIRCHILSECIEKALEELRDEQNV